MNALSALLFMSYVTGILTLRKRGGGGGSIDSQDFPSGALIFYTHNSPGVAGLKAH